MVPTLKRSLNRLLIAWFAMMTLIGGLFVPVANASGDTPIGAGKEIRFADAGWDSIRFHNAVLGTIANRLYGYTYREVPGGSTIVFEGLLAGEIDIDMELWTDNLITYQDDLKADKFKELSINFDDNAQGFYVPRYVIEGDPERGIEALAPNLKTVEDLKGLSAIFPDDEIAGKGRIYGSIPGWEVDEILYKKYLAYGLDQEYTYFRPGSESALAAAITSAYDKGIPIVSYYWEPTWLMGQLDMVILEDKPYDPATYREGLTALPAVKITTGANNEFYEENPQLMQILSKYNSTSQLTSAALAFLQETKGTYEDAAIWYIKENPELIRKMMSEQEYETLMNSIEEQESPRSSSGLLGAFPFRIPLDLAKIDSSVRQFSADNAGFFDAIRSALNFVINLINRFLDAIPWFITLAFVFVLGWKSKNKLTTGILYVALLSLIGAFGLWSLMNETLSIVITAVILSLLLGFPLGILISKNNTAHSIMLPVLDTMQTMPVFVYLIPALLFFGLGKAPGVVATTIYAIVPMIRMTNHGIRQIDPEIMEASAAFGSTYRQSLFKVQIPQALPTILTGVNQTIMMAMSMVVTTSMIGASGLGMEVLNSVNRIEIGRGLISGSAVVILAVILDRLTQGLFNKKKEESHE